MLIGKLRMSVRRFRMEFGNGIQMNGSDFPNMANIKRIILMIVAVSINRVSQPNQSLSLLYSPRVCREMNKRIQCGFLDCKRYLASNLDHAMGVAIGRQRKQYVLIKVVRVILKYVYARCLRQARASFMAAGQMNDLEDRRCCV